MTSMTEAPRFTYSEEDIRHPEWCVATADCEVRVEPSESYPGSSFLQGVHREPPQRIATQYGSTFGLGLICEVRAENRPMIGLRVSTSESCEAGMPFAWQDEIHMLEPEEAEMLGRRLMEAAQDWRSAARDNEPSRSHYSVCARCEGRVHDSRGLSDPRFLCDNCEHEISSCMS